MAVRNGMKFYQRAIEERYRPEHEVKVVLGEGRTVGLEEASPETAAQAAVEIRQRLNEIRRARETRTFVGMFDGSNDARPPREFWAAEQKLQKSLRQAEDIAADIIRIP